MSNRLDSIITRTGDDGTSQLADGTRLSKSHQRFEAMGQVDELNAHIGMLRCLIQTECQNPHIASQLNSLNEHISLLTLMQHQLFEIGSELAVPGMTYLSASALNDLENWAQRTLVDLAPLKEFILPYGTLSANQSHICRSVARRAERSLVALNQIEAFNPMSLKYINRSSDVFFILSRHLNWLLGQPETYWRGNVPST